MIHGKTAQMQQRRTRRVVGTIAAVVLAVVAILFSIGRVPVANLRNRLSPLTAAVFFYSLING